MNATDQADQAAPPGEVQAVLAQLNAGQIAPADTALAALLAAHPNDSQVWELLAMLRQRQGQTDTSVAAYERARQLAPQAPGLARKLAVLLLSAERLDAARVQAEAVLTLLPDDCIAHAILGRLKAMTGELPQAVAHFRQELSGRLQHPTPVRPPRKRSGFDSGAHLDLLWRTLAQLAAAGVHAFPTSGTLLGLEREGRLLPFDKDIDIGLPFHEMETAVACLRREGWRDGENNMRLINPLPLVDPASGLCLDLCGHTLEGEGHTVAGLWQAGLPWDWQRLTDYGPLNLKRVDSPAGPVWALCDPQAWLAALYGDWRTPDPDFDTVIGAHNLRRFSLLTQCYALRRISDTWQDGAVHKSLSLVRLSLRHLPDDALLLAVLAHLEAAQARAAAEGGA